MTDATDIPEILQARRWTTPSYYAGFDPVGDFILIAKNRDSNALERSNFECFEAQGEELQKTLPECTDTDPDHPGSWFYSWRAGHWAVGWVEYFMLRTDAPQKALDAAAETLDALEQYPVVDEDHFSQLEHDEVSDYWANCSIAERLDYIKRNDGNIFAARHDWLTESADPRGMIYDELRTP